MAPYSLFSVIQVQFRMPLDPMIWKDVSHTQWCSGYFITGGTLQKNPQKTHVILIRSPG